MDSEDRLQALVAPLRSDVVSGAATISRTAAEVMGRAAIGIPAGSLEELRHALGEAARSVLQAQPVMAPLVRLVRDVLAALDAAESVEDGRHAAATAAERFRSDLEAASRAVAEHGAEVLARYRTVATISSSSNVLAALSLGHEASERSVVCFESRPMREGRDLARALADAGIPTTLAVDAAITSLVPHCDAVLFGADSIGDRGVVNKIGSAVLAQTAGRAGIPAYVLADRTKILPHGFPQTVDDDRPGTEVWDAPPKVRVWNRYFEVVPMRDVTAVVTETGLLGPTELERVRDGVELPEVLRRWAEGR